MLEKGRLTHYAEIVHSLRREHPELGEHPNLFARLLVPWLRMKEGSAADIQNAEREREQLGAWGFDGETISNELRAAVAADKHLAECCGDALTLSYVLDVHFIRPAVDLLSENAPGRLDETFAAFHHTIFEQGPFSRLAYSHVFNLNCEMEDIDLGAMRLHKLRRRKYRHY